MKTSRLFCLNMDYKWKEVCRSRQKLFENHETWLQQYVPISTKLLWATATKKHQETQPGPSQPRGRPKKPFNEASLKTKKRRLAELVADQTPEELQFAAEMALKKTTTTTTETSSLTALQALALGIWI